MIAFYQITPPMARGCADFFRFTNIADLRLWSGRKHWESGNEPVVFRGRASAQMEEQTLGNSRSSEGEL